MASSLSSNTVATSDKHGTTGVGSVDKPPHGSTSHLNNLTTRALTIIVLVPIFATLAARSKCTIAILIWISMTCAGFEWTGVKRHLKVCLLQPTTHHGNNHHGETRNEEGSSDAKPSGGNTNGAAVNHTLSSSSSSASTPMLTAQRDVKQAMGDAAPLTHSLSELAPAEYSLPFFSLGVYNVVKHMAWSCLALAAYKGEKAYMVTLAVYFIIFVTVTLTAHNRLERKTEQAIELLGQNRYLRKSHAAHAPRSLREQQRLHFESIELSMIAEKQPAEQFVDFCLDIFGIFYISGLVYPVLIYDIPSVGLPWIYCATLSNFSNDIFALLCGRALKRLRLQYETQAAKSSTANGSSKNNKILHSVTSRWRRWLMNGPRPLYRAISPNKSLEGAIAGVLASSVSFTLLMHAGYRYVMPLPDPHIIAPQYNTTVVWLLVGFVMGILGVIGDLLESLLKRSAHVKDAGIAIPGHGGMLDRIDGLLLVFPFMYSVVALLQATS